MIHENMGGITSVDFAELNTINNFPKINFNIIEEEITFTGTNNWINFVQDPYKADFNEIQIETDNNDLYQASLTIAIPKYRPDINYEMFFSKYLLAKVTFANAHTIIVGLPTHPLVKKQEARSGRISADPNNIIFTFTNIKPVPSPFYNPSS